MKTIILFALLIVSGGVWAQPPKMKYLRDRAENNMRYLSNDIVIRNQVHIDAKGINVNNREGRTDYRLHWTEASEVVRWMENTDYYELIKFFDQKKTQHLMNVVTPTEFNYYKEYPTEWKGLRIVLDPGHFGGEKEKKLERREVKIKGSSVGRQQDLEFDEADLNYYTAMLIRNKLIARGVDEYDISITRSFDKSALGVDYETWLNTRIEADLRNAITKGDLKAEEYEEYRDRITRARADKNDPSHAPLFSFYRFLDFRERVHTINMNFPHVTYVIHYNASDDGSPDRTTGYVPVTDANYSMAFVPGGFLRDELVRTDHKIDFMRLLISPDLDNSMRLAAYFLDELKAITGVEPIPNDIVGDKIKNKMIQTDHTGVYARNLPLTRMVRGAVVYGESMYMNNTQEAIEFVRKDIQLKDWSGKEMWAPRRCDQVAEAYVKSIERYIEANKAIKANLFGNAATASIGTN